MWFLRDCNGKNVIWLKPNQEFTIGKRNKNLPTTDPSMSRTHAILSNIDNSVIVQDSNSTHGTWVKKCNSDFKREKQISLEDNDQVRFGLLTVYTIAFVETFVSYSSISSHDLSRLSLLCSKYDLSLKKDLVLDSLCLVTGGNTFSGKQALALVMQISVVSLEWIYAWDDVDSYSFEIPQFTK